VASSPLDHQPLTIRPKCRLKMLGNKHQWQSAIPQKSRVLKFISWTLDTYLNTWLKAISWPTTFFKWCFLCSPLLPAMILHKKNKIHHPKCKIEDTNLQHF
jgi:hypothetical protein